MISRTRCSECPAVIDPAPSSLGGRPRATCSSRCRQRRYLRKREERAREEGRLDAFEALLLEEGSEEQQRTYAELIRSVPGFREANDRALRKAFPRE